MHGRSRGEESDAARVSALRAERDELLRAIHAVRLLVRRRDDWTPFWMGFCFFPAVAVAVSFAWLVVS